MKMLNKNLLAVAALMILGGCSRLGCSRTHAEVLLVDVNDPDIYKDCHIKGAVNVPFEQAESFAKAYANKDATAVIYCANYQCLASSQIAQVFKQQGFKDVRVYEAGIAGWYQAHLPYDGEARQGFLNAKNEPTAGVKKADLVVIETDQLKSLLQKPEGHSCSCACCV